jgi:hypothetical protein
VLGQAGGRWEADCSAAGCRYTDTSTAPAVGSGGGQQYVTPAAACFNWEQTTSGAGVLRIDEGSHEAGCCNRLPLLVLTQRLVTWHGSVRHAGPFEAMTGQ